MSAFSFRRRKRLMCLSSLNMYTQLPMMTVSYSASEMPCSRTLHTVTSPPTALLSI